MTGNGDINRPDELTDAELDQLLQTASEELLTYLEDTVDSSRVLTAIMASSSTEHPDQLTPTRGQSTATLMVSLRVQAHDLAQPLDKSMEHLRGIEADSVEAKGVTGTFWSSVTFMISVLALLLVTLPVLFFSDLPFPVRTSIGLMAVILPQLLAISVTSIGRARALTIVRALVLTRALARARAVVDTLGVDVSIAQGRRLVMYKGKQVRFFVHRLEGDRGTNSRRLLGLSHDLARLKTLDAYRIWGRGISELVSIREALTSVRLLIDAIFNEPVDASGADLSQVKIKDLDALNGVVWTEQTTWPPGIADKARKQSDEILDGVYQVRTGNSPDRTGLTRVLGALSKYLPDLHGHHGLPRGGAQHDLERGPCRVPNECGAPSVVFGWGPTRVPVNPIP